MGSFGNLPPSDQAVQAVGAELWWRAWSGATGGQLSFEGSFLQLGSFCIFLRSGKQSLLCKIVQNCAVLILGFLRIWLQASSRFVLIVQYCADLWFRLGFLSHFLPSGMVPPQIHYTCGAELCSDAANDKALLYELCGCQRAVRIVVRNNAPIDATILQRASAPGTVLL
jgi:hypothetical protein